jgi:hypothetical protein
MTKQTHPICINCKFFSDADCMASADLVTGDTLSAKQSRSDANQCGPTGKWFVAMAEDWKEPRDKDGYRTE